MKRLLVVAFSVVASAISCGASDSPPPSCQDAIQHYYSAGCSYFDTTTNPPTPIPAATYIGQCQTNSAQTPDSCRDELDAWLVCNARVPSPAKGNADCDCSASFMSLLQCH